MPLVNGADTHFMAFPFMSSLFCQRSESAISKQCTHLGCHICAALNSHPDNSTTTSLFPDHYFMSQLGSVLADVINHQEALKMLIQKTIKPGSSARILAMKCMAKSFTPIFTLVACSWTLPELSMLQWRRSTLVSVR